MIKRSTKLLNKKFQLRTTLKILSLIVISYFGFIAITGTQAILKQKEIAKIVDGLEKAITVEENIINAFIDYSKTNMDMDSDEILALKKIKKDHKESMGTLNEYMELVKNYNREQISLLIVITVIMILLSVLAFFYLIRFTHHMTGPLYVIEQHIDTLLKGEKPALRELRENDEFKEFYDKFRKMAGRIKNKK